MAEAAEKALYLLVAQDPRRQLLIASVLKDFARLSEAKGEQFRSDSHLLRERPRTMRMNDRLNGFLWGTAMGAGAAVIVGLSMGWIVSNAKANVMANERAQTVLVAAMAPICVNRFRDTDGYTANLAALKGIKASWEQRDYVVKGNWANVGLNANYAVADACAEALSKL
jgi:hypothetical protein